MVKGQPDPVVGMGATLLSWTDRHAATIVEVGKDKQGRWIVTVQDDNAKRTDNNGFSEVQVYEYTRNPNGSKSMFRYEDGKGWRSVCRNAKGRVVLTESGNGLRIGDREKYHDYSF
jgi:hypothetical protein